MMKQKIMLVALTAVGAAVCAGQEAACSGETKNPIVEGWYADPQIRKYGNEYWVFPTVSDKFRKQTFFDAFSSSDLKTWKKHPRILTTNEVTWARGAMWAPDAHEVGGKYYFFFSANDSYPVSGRREDGEPKREPGLQGYGGIGVAVADRPEGPYRDLIGKPLIDRFWNGAQPIDQYAFEYKGDWYMVYGGWGRCNLVKLAKDFKSLVPFEDGSLWRDFTPKGYVEGSVMFERKGKWYFMYSCGGWTRDDYCVNYSVGDTPFGPFEFKGKVLGVKRPLATGAGHHSVIRVGEDDWRICYHRRPIPSKGPHHRVVCIDRMEFDANGDIKPIEMTKGDTSAGTNAVLRVGTCNVRVWAKKDLAEGNVWGERKDDLIALLRRLDMDVFGFQEVHTRPYRELCEGLKEWELVDDYEVSTPVAYRKSRFNLEKKGVFWLSETPDVPRSKGWGANYVRPCLYLILKDKRSGHKLCFVNTHTDHVVVKARVEGMKLIMERMKSFSEGLPVVFVGDHNDGPKSEMTAIARKFLKDARDISEKKDPGPINTYHAFGRAKPRERLRVDYIYVSDGIRVRDFVTHDDKRPGTDRYPSDHYPLSATIEL